jgi:hypothetical protein
LQVELAPLRSRQLSTAVDQQQLLVSDAFAPIVQSWALLTELVAESDRGVLELVEATGDTFIVAGPYNRATDEGYHAAARAIVALIRQLNVRLGGSRAFVAVATAGSACGALLGASKLTYRMFGGVIRESSALLEAAPRVPGLHRNVAFASETFRRQYSSPAVLSFPRMHRNGSANMSIAVTQDESMRSRSASPGKLEPDCITFTGRLLWRVKGVGAAVVSTIVL